MNKQVFMICNAHLDPVWQWEWEEGAAEAISTFRVAADFCEEYEGFVFNHNEALLYRWVEEYEPVLFERIRELVKKGRWHIMGGWYLQPDCNIPSGESFVRQILEGHKYFMEKFGVTPQVANNFDAFGHSRGLVQILAKSGYKGYIFCRPTGEVRGLPADLFVWKGFDGSKVMAQRMPMMYSSGRGGAVDKVKGTVEAYPDSEFIPCLWGMGDHGGGPSRIDIEALNKLISESAPEITFKHSTPEEFFERVEGSGQALPEFDGELNPWGVGCYTSQIKLKQKYRALENELYAVERMCAASQIAGLMKYPKEELSEAQRDMLMCQFHDILAGTSIQPGEQGALRSLDHGREIVSKLRARAFFALASRQRRAQADEIPILIYNPHPFEIEGDFECEMMLWGANFDEAFSMPQVYRDGEALPTQFSKEQSNLSMDWRKKVVFHGVLKPMQINRFDCKYTKLERKPAIETQEDNSYIYLEGGNTQLRIDKNTGYIDSWISDGRQYLREPISLNIIADSADPWEMTVNYINTVIGKFSLLSPEECAEASGVKKPLKAVRVIENGAVRTVVEAALGYNRSRAFINYIISKDTGEVQINVRLQWAELQKMVKLHIPAALKDARCMGQTAYGVQELPVDGRENVSQKYIMLKGEGCALAVINSGIYGSCVKDGALNLSLLRSAAYCAHPIFDRPLVPQDRYMPHMDLGETVFEFVVKFGSLDEIERAVPRRADSFNERPYALAFFPAGTVCTEDECPLRLEGDKVELTVFKQAEDGDGYILRLFNPFEEQAETIIDCCLLKEKLTVSLTPYEIKTIRLRDGRAEEASLIEKALD